jgi:diguanylate cyclase (GGDEF)-like protein
MPLLYVPTIYVLTLSVMTLLGLLTLFAWLQNRAIGALAWWSASVFLMAQALTLLCLRGAVADFLTIDAAYAVLFTSCGLLLEGARRFEGRPRNLALTLAGTAAWLVVCLMPQLHDSVTARTVIVSAIVGIYPIGCAYVMWQGRGEPLMSRWPLIVLLGLGGAMFIVRIPLAIMYPFARAAINSVDALQSDWYAVLSTSTLLFVVAVYFLFLALAKERTELAHKQAAMTDPLTGICNRRAFLDVAGRLLRRPQGARPAMAFLVFDLDRFKSINDNHGHLVGDRALCLFADTLRANLRDGDIAGRLGGEEFAAIVSGADRAAVLRVAERIRQQFAAVAEIVGETPLHATVSVGVSYCGESGTQDVAALCASADAALYRAKALGRNRVEIAAEPVPLAPDLPDVTAEGQPLAWVRSEALYSYSARP